MKKVLEHTGDPLKDMPAFALCGGVALYLLALYVVDVAPETEAYGDVGGAFIPQDAA